MRRALVVPIVATALLSCVAPALAQERPRRDPFVPLVSEEAGAEAPTAGAATTTVTTRETEPEVATARDGVPTTGSDPSAFLAPAFALIAIGTGLLAIVRFRHPARSP